MIDLIIILAFVAYSIANGFYNRAKASRNLEEYFLAGRTIKGWRAGFSLAATQFAADTPLLVVGLIASGGIFMLWRLWIYGFGFLVIVRRHHRRRTHRNPLQRQRRPRIARPQSDLLRHDHELHDHGHGPHCGLSGKRT